MKTGRKGKSFSVHIGGKLFGLMNSVIIENLDIVNIKFKTFHTMEYFQLYYLIHFFTCFSIMILMNPFYKCRSMSVPAWGRSPYQTLGQWESKTVSWVGFHRFKIAEFWNLKIFCDQILKNPTFAVRLKKQNALNPEILVGWEKYLVKSIRPTI